jgi:hypothetical protein
LLDWKELESSVLAAVAYPEEDRLLFAEFHTGEVYLYLDVPREESCSVLIPRVVTLILVFAIGIVICGWDCFGVGIDEDGILG